MLLDVFPSTVAQETSLLVQVDYRLALAFSDLVKLLEFNKVMYSFTQKFNARAAHIKCLLAL